MEYRKVKKLDEVISQMKGTDIVTVVNAEELRTRKDNITVYHEGTVSALKCRPNFISLSNCYVVDIFLLTGEKRKKHIIAIDAQNRPF